MGSALPKCCLPDSIVLAQRIEPDAESNPSTQAYPSTQAGDHRKLCLAAAEPSRAQPPQPPGGGSSPRLPKYSPHARAADSATILNDLDFLVNPEWQTMPQADEANMAQERQLSEEAEAATIGSAAAYTVAMKGLWHNCPDAMEIALSKVTPETLSPLQVKDAEFMRQKLEFTRIRQRFVSTCIEFHKCGPDDRAGGLNVLTRGMEEVERRALNLIALQPDELESQLPGLISKRDTIMLLSRVRDIHKELLAKTGQQPLHSV